MWKSLTKSRIKYKNKVLETEQNQNLWLKIINISSLNKIFLKNIHNKYTFIKGKQIIIQFQC